MRDGLSNMKSVPAYLLGLILVQAFCAAVFISDVVADLAVGDNHWHMFVETVASLALLIGIVLETYFLVGVLQRKSSLERTLATASRAVQSVIEEHFDRWRLTASERDVAALTVKGLSIAEIAKVRGSAEGTVKSHLNAIYKKSDARNRAEVMSHILDAMIDRPLLDADTGLQPVTPKADTEVEGV